jgi:hypothetical protein
MSLNQQYDIGSKVVARLALGNFATTQSSAAAATTQDGVTIDRQDGLRGYYSCKSIVSAAFTAGSSQVTATLALDFEHSSDGTSWDAFSTGTEPSAVTWGSTSTGGSTGTTGGTDYDTIEQSVNLVGARRYVRLQLPAPTFADCSSGSFFTGHGVIVFGGADELPAND